MAAACACCIGVLRKYLVDSTYKINAVVGIHILDISAISFMYLMVTFIYNVACGNCGIVTRNTVGILVIVTCCIVDDNTGLNVIGKYVEADAVALVLNRPGFDKNTVCKQIVTAENRRYTVHNVVACFLYVVADHFLKRDHSLNIQVSRARQKILLVIIFACELPSNQVTAVVKVLAFNKAVLILHPARGLVRKVSS